MEESRKSVRKILFDVNAPELKLILSSPHQSKKIQSIFFNYEKGPPRVLTKVEVLMEE